MSRKRGKKETATRELALERENEKLRRKVSRLEKQVDQGILLKEEPVDTDETEIPTAPKKPDLPHCPLCLSTNIASYTSPVGKKTRWGCKSCKKWKPTPQ